MATKRIGRTHTKTIGTKPDTGRRYVQNGKVRIEWHEGGKRRSRTVGPNTPDMRMQADVTLADLLSEARGSGQGRAEGRETPPPADSAESTKSPSGDMSFRELALMLLDAADQVADGIRNAARDLLKEFSDPLDESDSAPRDSGSSPPGS